MLLSSYPESHTFSLIGHSFSGARSCLRTTLDLTTSGQGIRHILRETKNSQETTCYESTATPTKNQLKSAPTSALTRQQLVEHAPGIIKKRCRRIQASREKTMVIATANVTCSPQVGSLLFHPGTTQCGGSNHWKPQLTSLKRLLSPRGKESGTICQKIVEQVTPIYGPPKVR